VRTNGNAMSRSSSTTSTEAPTMQEHRTTCGDGPPIREKRG
jgi:hypothetical protein